MNYIVATIKPWNIEAFRKYTPALPGTWHLFDKKEDLTPERIKKIAPRYIFFPHWSWIVPETVLEAVECVCFHMTDVPYGRGGSPLQNLIVRGHTETKLTALRMTKQLDAGPVYLKTPLSLEGTAQQIFERAGHQVYGMIKEIVEKEPVPQPQSGEIVEFERRTPGMSKLPETQEIKKLYDHIRMLDAETYPHAYIEHGPCRLTFTNARLKDDGTLAADVTIGLAEPKDERQ